MDKNTENINRFFKVSRLAFLCCAASFIAGAGAASAVWYLHNHVVIQKLSAEIKPIRQKNNPYDYINPLLGYEVPNGVKEFNEYKPLNQDIQNSISQRHDAGLNSYSVYFRDLAIGRWAGINENTAYAPASMMKVPIMIAYFKEAEVNPSVLGQVLKYSTSTADEINGVPLQTPSKLEVGKGYTVQQLIEAMIIASDNGAKNALLDNIDQKNLNDIYTDLGLPNPDGIDNYGISAKQYSLLLRVLYNATYLSRQYSEQALKIMSRAEYGSGLVAGVPRGTAVAQKFGESVEADTPALAKITFSNCGIVYHSVHPYILCVMVKGTDLGILEKIVAGISQLAWNQVNAYVASRSH